MSLKITAAAVVVVLAVAAVGIYAVARDGGSGDDTRPDTAGQQVVDAVGRTVTVPDTLKGGIVTVGSSGPLRFLSCFDVYDLIVEVDNGDVTDNKNGRAYSYAYPYDKLTRYHADNALESGTAESIGNLNPSLVIVQESVWNSYTDNCRVLASRCSLAVIKAQNMANMSDDNYGLSADLKDTFSLLGTLLGKEDRAAEIIKGIESILGDLRSLIGESTDNVYVAGVTINGSNTLNTTFPVYVPLSLIGGSNAYKGGSSANRITLNIEEFTKMAIDVIVIDPSSSDKMAEQDSQHVLEYLYKKNNNGTADDDVRLYVTVPIVWDSINYDCSLASAYYLSHLLYGTLTPGEVAERIDNIFAVFYGDRGSGVFEDMSEFFVQKSAANNAELPLLEEVLIKLENGTYRITAA
ncbi:MAG: ABC transporter substrate-binding protein [Candidatus Methanoplasma sp.]|jgi:iron complex transport system substrate-binding protein|nr:ABC transporter substrate-binding protein [Candidatus Methanoplasma sp.]